MKTPRRGKVPRNALIISVAAASLLALASASVAAAQGGTAKPAKGAVSPWVVPTLPDPAFSVATATLHGFSDSGVITANAVSNSGCPTFTDPNTFGGTATINGIEITIPCNLIVQMPANTVTWASFVNGSSAAGSALPVNGLELRVEGNMVGTQHIAGLAYASQLTTSTSTGVITSLNYADGSMMVDSANGGSVRVQLNDPVVPGLLDSAGNPTGRFSAGQSPDPRFSVDQSNPTVHSATGYPMCIPRTDPTTAGGDDPLCPQRNRPLAPPSPNPAPSIPACRNFSVAGVIPPVSGELSPPAIGQLYCSQFVMPVAGGATGPDARQQAPFEKGDYINFSGTIMTNGAASYVSAHTVEANLGIYTQPGSQPAYTAIGDFGVGTADPLAIATNGVAQETQNRIFLEAMTTDIKTPVDIYYEDANANGSIRNRWTTPFEMTGENATPLLGGPSGGITTQNSGPQPGRARLRATKAPAGLLSQPSRTVRVAQRSLCKPTPVDPTVTTIAQAALDACFIAAPLVANGLQAGQYVAPTFEFIFPENVKAGDLLVPADLWHLPFLRSGEGTGQTGALTPAPW